MNLRLLLPAAAALTLLAAAPASAQGYDYDTQGGMSTTPYVPSCQRFRNYHQRQRCAQEAMVDRRGYGADSYGDGYDGQTYYRPGRYRPGYDNGGYYPYYGGY